VPQQESGGRHEPHEPHEPWDRSPRWPTLPAALADAVAHDGDAVAVIDGDTQLTFADYDEQSLAVARALIAAGVDAGDRVALWVPNRWEWPVLCLGVWRAGAVVVPINTRLRGLEAADMLERSEAKLLFAVPEHDGAALLTLLHEARGAPAAEGRAFASLPALVTTVVLDPGEGTEGCVTFAAFLATASRVPPAAVVAREEALDADDVAEVLFTSGTTGRPKGVVLGHQQLLRSYWDWSGIAGLARGDRFLLTSPYSHGPGINGNLVASLLRRFSSVLVDGFDPDAVLDLMARTHVTAMLGPPNLYARLMVAAGDRQPTLRLALLGMATIPSELMARLRDEWAVGMLCNAYGAIESTVVSMTRPDDPPEVVERSSGRALPGVELRVVDDHGDDVAPGVAGELLIRSFAVMQRYWNAPDATAEAIDADGWFHSGDVATRDADGNVRIVDRMKDVFNVSGFSVYPAEVASLLLEHPGVHHAAVVPVPGPGGGEVGVAYVVPAAGGVDPDELLAWAGRSMASYKVPRHVVLVDEIPVASTGKTDRAGLQRRWAEADAPRR
jgi:acyl-CoA synthetase (AMP-forming)/AMP-acid ligase II